MANENKFPTEIVELPSKGYFYPKENPLSTGKVEIKYMTAKEEDILTSVNLIEQGIVLDVLLKELIVDKDIDLDTMLLGDKNALFISARVLAYGNEYEFTLGNETGTADLSTLKSRDIDFSKVERGINSFEYTIPSAKRELTFKLLTQKDDASIREEVEALKKAGVNIDKEVSTRLKHIITSVDGKADKAYINNFVDNEFLSRDTLAFRKHVATVTPDLDMEAEVTLSNGERRKVSVPMTVTFFWPTVK
jgi:hypothetical protein